MYTNNDIQDMINNLLNDSNLMKAFETQLDGTNPSDRRAIMSVVKEGWAEEFDRYDSDVCEQFIDFYEKAVA